MQILLAKTFNFCFFCNAQVACRAMFTGCCISHQVVDITHRKVHSTLCVSWILHYTSCIISLQCGVQCSAVCCIVTCSAVQCSILCDMCSAICCAVCYIVGGRGGSTLHPPTNFPSWYTLALIPSRQKWIQIKDKFTNFYFPFQLPNFVFFFFPLHLSLFSCPPLAALCPLC